jgi:hypothetical protein
MLKDKIDNALLYGSNTLGRNRIRQLGLEINTAAK